MNFRSTTTNKGFNLHFDDSNQKLIIQLNDSTANTTTEVMTIDTTGNVSCTKVTGNVTGDVTGNVTGDVTGNVSGSSGSCTGNAATATNAGSAGSCTGNASSATRLQTTRKIGGVNFNGTANINLPGVNIAGNQNTSGSSGSCTDSNLVRKNQSNRINGFIGINTDAVYPLTIASTEKNDTLTSGNAFFNPSAREAWPSDWGFNEAGSGGLSMNVAIRAQDRAIWAHTFACSSDSRIKTNIEQLENKSSLQKLRAIECYRYEYIDKVNKDPRPTLGFIAQEVKEVLTEAVSIQKQIIPNGGKVLDNLTWNGTTMISDLTDVSGVKCRFYVSNDISANVELKEIVGNSDNTFTFDTSYNNVFYYGNEVDDFHTLDKQKLFTLNFSATKEIDRIQQEEKTKLAAAEAEITNLKTQLAAVLARLDALESN